MKAEPVEQWSGSARPAEAGPVLVELADLEVAKLQRHRCVRWQNSPRHRRLRGMRAEMGQPERTDIGSYNRAGAAEGEVRRSEDMRFVRREVPISRRRLDNRAMAAVACALSNWTAVAPARCRPAGFCFVFVCFVCQFL